MRGSKRERVVAAALEIIGSQGVEALTFDAVAKGAGLTRAGVVYHFPSREALLNGIGRELLERWRQEALAALGKPPEQASQAERVQAFVISVLDGSLLPGELAFITSGRPEAESLRQAWETFSLEWLGDVETLGAGQRLALLAIEGLWTLAALGSPAAQVMDQRTRDLLLSMAAGDGDQPGTWQQSR